MVPLTPSSEVPMLGQERMDTTTPLSDDLVQDRV